MHRHSSRAPRSAAPGEYLTFMLDGQEYGLDCARVQELKLLKSLERFAEDGEIIGGVALSHGVIMPVVDMRTARAQHAIHPDTDVIILRLSSGLVGMVVEGVTGIAHVRADAVQAVPDTAGAAGATYLIGIATVERRRVVLIDIDRLMSLSPRRPLRAA